MSQLLQSLDQAKAYVPLSNAFAGAAPAAVPDLLLQAEETYLHPSVSPEVCALVAGNVEAHAALATLLKRAVAYFAVADYVPLGTVQIQATGIVEEAGDKKKQAKPENIEALRKSLVGMAYNAVEQAILFLEKNKGNYAAWVASEAYTLAHDSLCVTATTFNQFVPIGQRRRVFLALLPSLREVEQVSIIPTLTGGVYDQLKTAPANGQAPDVLRRRHVLPALCHLAYAQALPGMMLIPDYDTLLTLEVKVSAKAKKSAQETAILAMSEHHHKLGMLALNRIPSFIQSIPEAFPDYPAAPATADFDFGLAIGEDKKVIGFF